MTRKSISFAALIVLSLCFSTCATIIRGSNQKVVILSQPKVANIEIDGQDAGQTPFFSKLERRRKHVVRISLEGYEPYEITLNRKLNGWIFGNLLLGGVIGIAVDIATGSMYSLTPKDVYADLQAKQTAGNNTKDDIYMTLVLKPKPDWKKIGQMDVSTSGK